MADVGTPLWWVDRLEQQLIARQGRVREMDEYYRGDHPLPFVTKAHNAKMRDEFSRLLEESKSNFMGLVVDTTEERLAVEGFRLSASTDEQADSETWKLWQQNNMDAESSTAILEALVKGVSYLSVWGDGSDQEKTTVAVEDPLQTIVCYTPGSNYRLRDAALKVWTDDYYNKKRANLYLPDGIYKFEAPLTVDQEQQTTWARAIRTLTNAIQSPSQWKEIRRSYVRNPTGIVPIVPIRNRGRVLIEGTSELADVYRVQNQINGFLFLLALAGYFGAHRQRWATGLTIMEDEETGKPIEPFDVAVDKLWWTEDGEDKVRFGEFSQTDLGGYIKAIEQKVLHIAVTTRTPRHYLIEQGQSPSGDAIKSAESGLVMKCGRRQRGMGEGFEETMRLARAFSGMAEAPPDSEIVWKDAATPTIAETTDAVIKQYAAKLIPWETAVRKLGYSQTEVARMSAERQADALITALQTPEPTSNGQVPPGQVPTPEPEVYA